MKTSGLGKGLSALLGSSEQNLSAKVPIKISKEEKHSIRRKNKKKIETKSKITKNRIGVNEEYQYISLKNVIPNPFQPRKDFDEMGIEDLSQSIAKSGFIAPIIVTRKEGENRYILVAGERRLRACKSLGLAEIPAIIRSLSDKEMMQIAIIENVQRKELSPIEEAKAYEKMITHLNISSEEVAEIIGLPHYYISQKLKLNKLPESIQYFVANKDLSEGASLALLKLDSDEAMIAAAKMAVRQKMTRTSVEKLVEKILMSKGISPKTQDFYFRSKYQYISDAFKDNLGWDIKIRQIKNGKGKIEIEFLDEINLKDIYSKLEGILE